jgi:cardiolipin synthase
MPTGAWPMTLFFGELLLKIAMILVVLLRKRGASSTLAWILVIMALPLVGSLLYLALGEVRLGRRNIRRHREIVGRIEAAATRQKPPAERPAIPVRFQHVALLAEAVCDTRATGGNSVRVIGDSDLFIQSLIEDIETAHSHCHVLSYIYLADHSGARVAEALMRAARRGVACRVLVDAVGSEAFLRSALRTDMASAGVRVVEALDVHPLRMLLSRIDLRNHRKIAVIDGVIGYTGSQNIADAAFAPKPKYAPWVDAAVRIEGPVVRDLQILFVEDWFLSAGESLEDLLSIVPPVSVDDVVAQVIGTGPNSYNEALRQLHQVAFHAAREELILTTPYFVPDEATLTALCTTARRGVDTMLVVPARNDSPLVAAASRGHYSALMNCGVKIFEYQRGLLHAKTLTVDRDLALIGTANLDRRSFELNFEVNLVVYDDDLASQLRFLQRGYMADSAQVDPARWERTRWPIRVLHSAAITVSPLL